MVLSKRVLDRIYYNIQDAQLKFENFKLLVIMDSKRIFKKSSMLNSNPNIKSEMDGSEKFTEAHLWIIRLFSHSKVRKNH